MNWQIELKNGDIDLKLISRSQLCAYSRWLKVILMSASDSIVAQTRLSYCATLGEFLLIFKI